MTEFILFHYGFFYISPYNDNITVYPNPLGGGLSRLWRVGVGVFTVSRERTRSTRASLIKIGPDFPRAPKSRSTENAERGFQLRTAALKSEDGGFH